MVWLATLAAAGQIASNHPAVDGELDAVGIKALAELLIAGIWADYII